MQYSLPSLFRIDLSSFTQVGELVGSVSHSRETPPQKIRGPMGSLFGKGLAFGSPQSVCLPLESQPGVVPAIGAFTVPSHVNDITDTTFTVAGYLVAQ